MVRPTHVPTKLRQLAAGIATDPDTVHDALSSLVAALQATAASYHGLSLRLGHHGCLVTLTEFADGDLVSAASLRVDLALIVDVDPVSRVVFYAAAPGAFVDLAADLHHTLKGSAGPRRPSIDGSRVGDAAELTIEVDGDLPPVSTVSRLVGLAEFSTINRAVGVLIDGGQLPDAAREALRRGAAEAGVEMHVFAADLLGR